MASRGKTTLENKKHIAQHIRNISETGPGYIFLSAHIYQCLERLYIL